MTTCGDTNTLTLAEIEQVRLNAPRKGFPAYVQVGVVEFNALCDMAARTAKAQAAIRGIASLKTSNELAASCPQFYHTISFDTRYDEIIADARAALSSPAPEKQDKNEEV